MKYRFLGAESLIGAKRLTRFGEVVELDESLAREAVLGGCAILPEDVFATFGFTDAELKQFAYPAQRAGAPEDFKAKVHAALVAVHDWRLAEEAK